MASDPTVWPELELEAWQDTRATFQLWTQVVGKIRMAHTPLVNHWWNVPLYVTARGLTTSLVPYDERGFEMEFDLLDHRLDIRATDGGRAVVALEPRTVASFYDEVMSKLAALDLATTIWPMPVEIPGDVIPFPDDTEHASYDGDAVQRFWRVLVESDRLLQVFRARWLGKVSPVHFFWGGMDLAVTRFSGRSAPRWVGRAPHCGPFVMEEAYSHEVSSAGFWPSGGREGAFYSFAYAEPDGFRDAVVLPDVARYDTELGEFLLPYEAVRAATDPDALVLEFLQGTYEATADLGGWDRSSLERR